MNSRTRIGPTAALGAPGTMGRTFAAAALLAAATLVSPGGTLAAIATPYDVEVMDGAWQPLPIEDGGPVKDVLLEVDHQFVNQAMDSGSGWLELPFPVRFFGSYYTDAAVSARGFVSFGPRSQTLCGGFYNNYGTRPEHPSCANQTGAGPNGVGPIPRGLFPNRMIAAWWSEAFSCGEGGVKQQTLGVAPDRTFVVEWMGCTLGDMQVWLHEGASAIEVRFSDRAPPANPRTARGFTGLMSPIEGGGVEGYNGLFCSKAPGGCEAGMYPAGKIISYRQGIDLAITELSASAQSGVGGMKMQATARMANIGGGTNRPATARFLLNSRPALDADAVEIGRASEFYELGMDESVEVSTEVTLPNDVLPGTYYMIAQADPTHAETADRNPTNNVKVFGPIVVDARMPLLTVSGVDTDVTIAPGTSFNLSWTIRNDGSDLAPRVPFAVMLSVDAQISLADRLIGLGELSIEAFSEQRGDLALDLPADVLDGAYFIGILIDPDQTLPRSAVPMGGATEPVYISSSELRILTTSLPSATLGAGYCLRLDAAGGGGRPVWTLASSSDTLPPGLRLEEHPEGAKEAGRPFYTMLCGIPSKAGSFSFELQVSAGAGEEKQQLELEVGTVMTPLRVATTDLPAAAFMAAYDAKLRGVGGRAPFHWKLVDGRLPAGVVLRGDGAIVGAPAEDGRFPITVRLVDADGRGIERATALLVAPPTRLTCGTRMLPAHSLGDVYSLALSAAGGAKPYRWRSRETRRLAGALGESAVALGTEPPPGISLGGAGEVSGAATRSGRFLWTVEVTDSAKNEAVDLCTIVVDVAPAGGLTISTMGLPPAAAGYSYRATLAASGGVGGLVWSLPAGSRLPVGLVLTSAGIIEGIPEYAQLESRPARDFAFLVEVQDGRGSRGVAPLSIQVKVVSGADGGVVRQEQEEGGGGCVAGEGGGAWLAGLTALLWGTTRRRKGGPCR